MLGASLDFANGFAIDFATAFVVDFVLEVGLDKAEHDANGENGGKPPEEETTNVAVTILKARRRRACFRVHSKHVNVAAGSVCDDATLPLYLTHLCYLGNLQFIMAIFQLIYLRFKLK